MKTLRLKPPVAPECDIQRALMERLSRRGFVVLRVSSGARKTENGGWFRAYAVIGLKDERGYDTSKGFPDVLALKGDGQLVEAHLFEIKKIGGEMSPPQEKFRDFAATRGVTVHVIEGWDEMERIVAALGSLKVR